MRHLVRFDISVRDTDFLLHLEDDAGEILEFAASPERVDAIIDALDDLLSDEEEEILEAADEAGQPSRTRYS